MEPHRSFRCHEICWVALCLRCNRGTRKYNVLDAGEGRGDELYGVAPASFYVKNLFLNTTVAFPLAVALPFLAALLYPVADKVMAGTTLLECQACSATVVEGHLGRFASPRYINTMVNYCTSLHARGILEISCFHRESHNPSVLGFAISNHEGDISCVIAWFPFAGRPIRIEAQGDVVLPGLDVAGAHVLQASQGGWLSNRIPCASLL